MRAAVRLLLQLLTIPPPRSISRLAAALGKSIVVLNPPEHQHALKEVHAAALAVAEEPRQVVEILRYVLTGKLPA